MSAIVGIPFFILFALIFIIIFATLALFIMFVPLVMVLACVVMMLGIILTILLLPISLVLSVFGSRKTVRVRLYIVKPNVVVSRTVSFGQKFGSSSLKRMHRDRH